MFIQPDTLFKHGELLHIAYLFSARISLCYCKTAGEKCMQQGAVLLSPEACLGPCTGPGPYYILAPSPALSAAPGAA